VLNRRTARRLRPRTLASTLTALLIASLLAAVTPATSAVADDPPPDPGGSAIGGGATSPLEEYIEGSIVNNGDSELTVGNVSDNVCVTLPEVVAPADIPERYRIDPPTGKGKWEYQICSNTAANAQLVASRTGTVARAKSYCATETTTPRPRPIPCAVFAYWHPEVNTPPPAPSQSRESYFESFFRFSPLVGTSPPNDNQGLIANFPTWFWNRVETRYPKAVGDLGLFGGLAATAWHLETTLETDGGPVCDVSGLRKVGTEWNAGQYPPEAESPSRCGHTYKRMGIYNIHGCSRWLIIAVGPFFAIVFPITVCSNTPMTVKESQILTGGGARRAPVR
jgi:hypothetical protein